MILGLPKTKDELTRFVRACVTGAPAPRTLPCAKLGGDSGKRVTCPTCAGKVELYLLTCAEYGVCTPQTPVDGVACCVTCKKGYEPKYPPWDRSAGPLRYDQTNLFPDLPGHRFNPALIEWKDGYAFCWRDGWAGCNLWACMLDAGFLPKGAAVKLDITHPDAPVGREDPQFFVFRGQLHVAFVGVHSRPQKTSILYARLGDGFEVEAVYAPKAPGVDPKVWQKNWLWHEYDGELYAHYFPGRVLRVNGNGCGWAYDTPAGFPWTGGQVRGGASPVRVGNEYWSFFHDCVDVAGVRTYRVGLYTFRTEPPFDTLRYVPDPILTANPATNPGNYCHCIFPRGAVRSGPDWVLSCGVHDRFTELHELKHSDLESRLVPIPGRVPPSPTAPAPPPVYGLYCEELPDRRRVTDAHLRERGIVAKWWRSVHGTTWRIRSDDEPTSPGMVGLVLGHWHLWQHLWESGVEEAIVVEDDVEVPPNFAVRLAEMHHALPPTWQFVHVGLLESDELIEKKVTAKYRGGLVRLADPFGTHCYMIRRSALPVLMKRVADARTQIDILIYQNVLAGGHLEWYACHPSLAGQRTRTGEWPQST